MNDTPPEQLTREQIESMQLERLHELLSEVHDSNPFWTARMQQAGIAPGDVNSLDDFRKFPITVKAELVDDQNAHPPYGTNLTYPLRAYSRLHQTSGTTGKPMRWLDTPRSWDWIMDCWAQIYRIVGLREDDVLAFPFSFGPFIGFWAAFEGANRLGNLCLPMGGMTSEARLRMIAELAATVVCCTPTYALRLVDVAEEKGIDLAATAVRMLIVAGEPGGNIPAVRKRIEEGWGARVFDHWGMTDIASLGIEPEANPGGLLILETECIAEIVDPETGEPRAPGEVGELLITNLGRWGHPVIRYRTGDLVRAATEPCASGLHLLRLEGGILGRADDMLTIRGNNVFPSSIEAILREIDEVAEYRIVVERVREMQHLRLEIEPTEAVGNDEERLQQLLVRIGTTIKDRLNFQAEITPVATGSLPRFEMKGRRLVRNDR
ncbi:MAG: phenylacetate--CoA ligase family protein [Planctomycetota bacterium]|nr:MAG: phenylacetate--CoA ligase family protein [Planctomycetota bacterium]